MTLATSFSSTLAFCRNRLTLQGERIQRAEVHIVIGDITVNGKASVLIGAEHQFTVKLRLARSPKSAVDKLDIVTVN